MASSTTCWPVPPPSQHQAAWEGREDAAVSWGPLPQGCVRPSAGSPGRFSGKKKVATGTLE